MKLVNIFLVILIVAVTNLTLFAQPSTGDYRSKATGNWSTAGTWEKYNGTVWVDATESPTYNDGTITILNDHTVTITTGLTFDQVIVESSGAVQVNPSVSCTLGNGDDETDLIILGTWTNSGGTWTISPGAAWKVDADGTYIHNTTSGIATPLNSATLDPQSNFIYRGSSSLNTSISVANRTYGNLTFESTAEVWNKSLTGTSAFTVKGNLDIGGEGSGTFSLDHSGASSSFNAEGRVTIRTGSSYTTTTGIQTFKGDLQVDGTLTFSPSTNPAKFDGTTIISGSSLNFTNGLTVSASKSLELRTDIEIPTEKEAVISGILKTGTNKVTGEGAFSLVANASLWIGSPDGITSSGSTGNIQTATRTYSEDGYYYYYYYSGAATQVTGNGLPLTIKRLYFANPSGVTLTNDVSITNRLEFLTENNNGIINGNGKTITLGSGTENVGTAVGGTNGHINGKFKRWISTNDINSERYFYTGTDSKSRNAIITFNEITSGGTILAEFVAYDAGQWGLPLDDNGYEINKVSPDGYWKLTAGDGFEAGIYQLRLVARNFSGVSDWSKLRVIKRIDSSNPWSLDGTAGENTGSTSVPSVIRNGMTGFSEFGIGSNTTNNPLPVELSNFAAIVKGNNVELRWKTEGEVNSYLFEIERAGENSGWEKAGEVKASGNSNSPKEYSFLDQDINANTCRYRLRMVDNDGTYQYSDVVEVNIDKPEKFAIRQNYPNPFNPSTAIEYQIPEKSHVTLKIFDILGNEVEMLVNEVEEAGYYKVNYFPERKNISSGTYLYRITVTGEETGKISSEVKKMQLIK